MSQSATTVEKPRWKPKKGARIEAPARKVAERIKDFSLIYEPLTLEEAASEAMRCIMCKKPKCVEACYAHNPIPDLLRTFVEEGADAASFWNTYPLTAVCGTVCYHPCEDACVLGIKGEAVHIRGIEQAVGFHLLEKGIKEASASQPAPSGKKVAIVGAGPAGLMAAYTLVKEGHRVEVFEKDDQCGGMLIQTLPSYRLPHQTVHQVTKLLEALGVQFHLSTEIGKERNLEHSLQSSFDAVILAFGADKEMTLGIQGEELPQVVPALDFLRKTKRTESYPVGDSVIVIGGGNTAIDAARTALRLGANVKIVYRRTRREMPAHEEEIEAAEEEGIALEYLRTPISVEQKGNKLKVRLQEMELGEPDESGRRRPMPIEGKFEDIEVSLMVLAIGQNPNSEALASALEHARNGRVLASERGETNLPKVFACGDAVTGPSTVSEALYAGEKVARAVLDALHANAT